MSKNIQCDSDDLNSNGSDNSNQGNPQSDILFDDSDWENRDPDRILAQRLKEIIDTYDMNRTQLSIKIDISESYLSNLVKGRRPFTESFSRKFCRKTGISYKWFLRGEGPVLAKGEDRPALSRLAMIKADLGEEDYKFLQYLFSKNKAERIIFYSFIKEQ